MNNPLRARGMADVAFEAYYLASKNASIDIEARPDLRIVQAIGDALASKGYHHTDGVLDGANYTAAFDASVKGLSKTQIATWIECLSVAGCAVFFRNWPGNLHLHGNYCGVPQKPQLDGQDEDFFAGRDGLVHHRRIDDEWWFPEIEGRRVPEAMFRLSNPRNGKAGQIVRSPLATPPVKPVPLSNGFYLNDEAKPRFWMPVFDGVSYAPVRAFGAALGLDVEYNPTSRSITFDGDDQPIALRLVGGVGHAPLRQLVREVGLRVVAIQPQKVVIGR